MSEERKSPLAPWIFALLIGLPVTYAASIGPASRLSHDPACPDWINRKLPSIYGPVFWCLENVPESVSDIAFEYIALWQQRR